MEEFEVTRQHDETSMAEVVGMICEEFIAVCDRDGITYKIFYIKLSGYYHRFYTDAGLLFWQSGDNPDEDDDLYGGDRYFDLGTIYDIKGSAVDDIIFRNDQLTMGFSSGVKLVFETGIDEVGARIVK